MRGRCCIFQLVAVGATAVIVDVGSPVRLHVLNLPLIIHASLQAVIPAMVMAMITPATTIGITIQPIGGIVIPAATLIIATK